VACIHHTHITDLSTERAGWPIVNSSGLRPPGGSLR
jgi:hypothetical protein